MPMLDDLSPRQCIYFAALLGAQECRLAVTPMRRLTEQLISQLAAQGVIESPDAETPSHPSQETPLEGIRWSCSWHEPPHVSLMVELGHRLRRLPFDDGGAPVRLQIWHELALAEAEHFLERQLLRHRLDRAWCKDVAFAHRDTHPALSIAQWRYCCWAAVRQGAALAMRQAVRDDELIRESIYAELRRRATQLSQGQWSTCALPPFDLTPRSALGQLTAFLLLGSAELYWTTSATTEVIAKR